MRNIIMFLCGAVSIIAGIFLWCFWASALISWLGFILGIIVSIIFTPGLFIFPLIYWIVEGELPIMYFILWLIGVVGATCIGVLSRRNKN